MRQLLLAQIVCHAHALLMNHISSKIEKAARASIQGNVFACLPGLLVEVMYIAHESPTRLKCSPIIANDEPKINVIMIRSCHSISFMYLKRGIFTVGKQALSMRALFARRAPSAPGSRIGICRLVAGTENSLNQPKLEDVLQAATVPPFTRTLIVSPVSSRQLVKALQLPLLNIVCPQTLHLLQEHNGVNNLHQDHRGQSEFAVTVMKMTRQWPWDPETPVSSGESHQCGWMAGRLGRSQQEIFHFVQACHLGIFV